VAGIFDVGRLLIQAKIALAHGEWQAMCDTRLPFGPRTAQRLMAIANDERLLHPTRGSLLPPHWRTLYDLTTLDDDVLRKAFDDGVIRPDMERSDIFGRLKAQRREQREAELADKIRALPTKKYGVIVADPEWQFEPWSRETGMDRAAANHYPTSPVGHILARDVASLAADDCVLFLWATAPALEYALACMEGWGFDYKSHCVWNKDKKGTGYWLRNAHELLLVGTHGNVPAPAPGTQWSSVIDAPREQHSAKPEIFLRMIEEYFPSLPKVELNRRGPARNGWDCWGLEVESETAPSSSPPPDTPGMAAPAPVAVPSSPNTTGALTPEDGA
jgi:N6-adenosine-specific RNA methylase IME4